MAHDLIGQRMQERATINGENKSKLEDTKNGYAGRLPLCNKCKLYHNSSCTIKCNNYKKTSHMAREYMTPTPATVQRPLVNNQRTLRTYLECELQGHYRNACPKLKNQNHGNQGCNGGNGGNGGAGGRAFFSKWRRSSSGPYESYGYVSS
nr:hypothetical protein [Tanacetum cinerariifolium]